MIFEWSEHKRQANLRKHRLDFADCSAAFAREMLNMEDDRLDYGEPRTLGVGLLEGTVVAVVFVESGGIVRIISMRKANRREQEAYFKRFADGLEAH